MKLIHLISRVFLAWTFLKFCDINYKVIAEAKKIVKIQEKFRKNSILQFFSFQNDNQPRFIKKVYAAKIIDNIPWSPPSPIIQLTAEDKDIGINGDLYFDIYR